MYVYVYIYIEREIHLYMFRCMYAYIHIYIHTYICCPGVPAAASRMRSQDSMEWSTPGCVGRPAYTQYFRYQAEIV